MMLIGFALAPGAALPACHRTPAEVAHATAQRGRGETETILRQAENPGAVPARPSAGQQLHSVDLQQYLPGTVPISVCTPRRKSLLDRPEPSPRTHHRRWTTATSRRPPSRPYRAPGEGRPRCSQRSAQCTRHAQSHRAAAGQAACAEASTPSPPRRSTRPTRTCSSAATDRGQRLLHRRSRSTARWCAARCASATR